MKEVIKEVLNIKVPILEPDSLKEATAQAGSEEKLLTRLNGYGHAHGSFGDARELIVEVVQELTKVPFLTQKVKVKKDGKEVEVTERDWDKDSDKKYVARALAATPAVTLAQVESLVQIRARGYKAKDKEGKEYEVSPLAVSFAARVPKEKGPKTLPAKYKTQALTLITTKLIPGGAAVLEKLNKWFASKGVGAFTPIAGQPLDSDANVEALGWLAKAEVESREAFGGLK